MRQPANRRPGRPAAHERLTVDAAAHAYLARLPGSRCHLCDLGDPMAWAAIGAGELAAERRDLTGLAGIVVRGAAEHFLRCVGLHVLPRVDIVGAAAVALGIPPTQFLDEAACRGLHAIYVGLLGRWRGGGKRVELAVLVAGRLMAAWRNQISAGTSPLAAPGQTTRARQRAFVRAVLDVPGSTICIALPLAPETPRDAALPPGSANDNRPAPRPAARRELAHV